MRAPTLTARARCAAGDARRAGRRPARPHVRACGAADGLLHGGARSRSGQPGRPRQPPPRPGRLPRRGGPGRAGAAARRDHHRVRERARRLRWHRLAAQRPVAPGAAAVAIAQDRAAREGAFRALRRRLRAVRRDRDGRAARRRRRRTAARHPQDRAPGLRRQGPASGSPRAPNSPPPGTGSGGVPCVLEKLLPLAAECSVIVARGARRPHGAPAGAAQPAPRRHPRRRPRCRRAASPSRCSAQAIAAAALDRRRPGLRRRAVRRVLRAAATARWWSTRWRRARTTAATTAWTPATSRSSNCRCARWPACRCAAAAPAQPGDHAQPAGRPLVRRRRRSASARRPGPACSRCPARTCTCTASSSARAGRKMGHLTVDRRRASTRCATRALAALPRLLGIAPF